ncbi:hypothetical protein EVAR_76901_1 [Eumeta japonica]|uniref:Uncharacterized protein n=1 Tax=Eumeta variegata TaxID=151549 RepID=A0A4C1SEL9_EUMVA|nr:hypothetical protein EVAR_76901_1 [Eumeta japonica]
MIHEDSQDDHVHIELAARTKDNPQGAALTSHAYIHGASAKVENESVGAPPNARRAEARLGTTRADYTKPIQISWRSLCMFLVTPTPTAHVLDKDIYI